MHSTVSARTCNNCQRPLPEGMAACPDCAGRTPGSVTSPTPPRGSAASKAAGFPLWAMVLGGAALLGVGAATFAVSLPVARKLMHGGAASAAIVQSQDGGLSGGSGLSDQVRPPAESSGAEAEPAAAQSVSEEGPAEPVWVDCSICAGSGACAWCKGSRQMACPTCRGTGKDPATKLSCLTCSAIGKVSCTHCSDGICAACRGRGKVPPGARLPRPAPLEARTSVASPAPASELPPAPIYREGVETLPPMRSQQRSATPPSASGVTTDPPLTAPEKITDPGTTRPLTPQEQQFLDRLKANLPPGMSMRQARQILREEGREGLRRRVQAGRKPRSGARLPRRRSR